MDCIMREFENFCTLFIHYLTDIIWDETPTSFLQQSHKPPKNFRHLTWFALFLFAEATPTKKNNLS